MSNQAFYIWLQQVQDLWKPIQNFIINNKDILIISFGTGSLLAAARFIWWLVQQNRKGKLLPDTFPFEVIKPQSNALPVLVGGNENDPLADYNIPYQDRVPGRNTQDELKQRLDENRWLLILAPTGWGKTREAANLAQRLNNEGWTILKLKRGEWLEAPPTLQEDKIGTDRKLLFFLDDLNNKMYGGRIEQSPKADDPLQPLTKSPQERLFNALLAYEILCRKEDIRIIATARNEKEREFPDEPSEWEKLEFDKYALWKRFTIYDLPEPNEEAIIGVLRETIPQANIQANPDDYSCIAQRNDRTFRNIVENLRSTKNYDRVLSIDNFRDTLNGTWEERYQKAVKKYPVAIYIYDAVELLQKMGIYLYPFTIKPTAQMMVDGNLLRQVWYWWQISRTLPYLIDVEGILEPRDGQIEAKGKQIEVEEYISRLLNLLLKLAKRYPTKMFSPLVTFGYEVYQLDYYQEALKSINKSIHIAPKGKSISLLLLLQGNILSDFGRWEEAIASYEIAISIKSDDHEIWFSKGIALERLEKNEEAITSYDKAIEIKPDFYDAWYNKGILMRKLGKNEEAIASYDKAIKIKPELDYAWNNKGNILHYLGRHDESLAAFNEAIVINPENPLAWYNKGLTLKYLHLYEEAIKSYDEAIKIKPDYYEAWHDKGNALIYMKQNNQALTIYEEIIKKQPDFNQAWMGKANALYNLGKNKEAIDAFDEAIKIKPDYHEAWYNKGVVLAGLGKYEEAIAAWDAALKITPEDHKAWYCKAGCYALQGNVEQAITNLQQAINLNSQEYRELVKTNPDFDSIRNDARFQALLQD